MGVPIPRMPLRETAYTKAANVARQASAKASSPADHKAARDEHIAAAAKAVAIGQNQLASNHLASAVKHGNAAKGDAAKSLQTGPKGGAFYQGPTGKVYVNPNKK